MSKYIDAGKFYAKAVKWESEALAVLANLDPNTDHTEYVKWSAILNERTSFKHDIMDFEKAVAVEEVRHGKWVLVKPRRKGRNATYKCTVCKRLYSSYYNDVLEWAHCPCGAKMDGLFVAGPHTCKQCEHYEGCIYLQFMDKQSHQDPCGYFALRTTLD